MLRIESMVGARNAVVLLAVSALAIVSTIAVSAQQPSRASDKQVQELLNRIDAGTDTFRVNLDRAIDRSRLRGSRAADDISQSVNGFRRLPLDCATERLVADGMRPTLKTC
jgi:hypothetical protein